MRELDFSIETPNDIASIDFKRMSETYEMPIDVMTDLEGTVSPWDWRSGRTPFDSGAMDSFADASREGYIRGIHPITNRAGRSGVSLISLFSAQVRQMPGSPDSVGRTPLTRSERKPKGVMSACILRTLAAMRELERPDAYEYFSVAFIGDKFTDMKEAKRLHDTSEHPVVGFMVPRLGNTDHPLDILFGNRRAANKSLEEQRLKANGIFIKEDKGVKNGR